MSVRLRLWCAILAALLGLVAATPATAGRPHNIKFSIELLA
jgi:hypothetical protein